MAQESREVIANPPKSSNKKGRRVSLFRLASESREFPKAFFYV
ncbi:Uncharacterized protein dnm_003150 [Desulfonema magnum]|uniref:Uncharacterized protein n=1 Tax=Desulfonema magnum TaxID=45655 RepID=A0A975BFA7_9BACT|nr:Uncharacterized protein dnm_003150 [Desulfonema magnum]